jgi:hypothetical protein
MSELQARRRRLAADVAHQDIAHVAHELALPRRTRAAPQMQTGANNGRRGDQQRAIGGRWIGSIPRRETIRAS